MENKRDFRKRRVVRSGESMCEQQRAGFTITPSAIGRHTLCVFVARSVNRGTTQVGPVLFDALA